MITYQRVPLLEKAGYALGDGAANIAWRGVATFLFIFYTDVFGISPITVGWLMLFTRISDGFTDVAMGIICDRTDHRYGKFRPWILWTAIPLAVVLSLLFTTPDLTSTGKIIYAYITYILFTLIYTANNIPYGALMAVITGDDKERTVIGSYRMIGAFAGGMIVQGVLLALVAWFGNVDPQVTLNNTKPGTYQMTVVVPVNVENAYIQIKDGIAEFTPTDSAFNPGTSQPTHTISQSLSAQKPYHFMVTGPDELNTSNIMVINQKSGYSHSIYLLSVFLAAFMLITFYSTKERVKPPKEQKPNLKNDLNDLIKNRPWVVLLFIGLLFNVYNSIKQGITVIYFTHYVHNQLLAGSYLIGLMVASIAGAMITGYLGRKLGKKALFIYALIFSAVVNAMLIFCGPNDILAIFTLGMVSEFASAIFPTLFFAMLGDAADYSEYTNGRRATGLVYSAGSFASKFGGGLAGVVIGAILGFFNYNGQDAQSIQGAIPGILMLMSWVPALIALLAALFMSFYPLTQAKMDEITTELHHRRTPDEISQNTL